MSEVINDLKITIDICLPNSVVLIEQERINEIGKNEIWYKVSNFQRGLGVLKIELTLPSGEFSIFSIITTQQKFDEFNTDLLSSELFLALSKKQYISGYVTDNNQYQVLKTDSEFPNFTGNTISSKDLKYRAYEGFL